MMWMRKKLTEMPTAESALPGRPDPLPVSKQHYVSGNPIIAIQEVASIDEATDEHRHGSRQETIGEEHQ